MGKVFVHEQPIRFSHCDPAGIVYYPRFFDLQHATMEDWFARGLGVPLPRMIHEWRLGVPTVTIQCDFRKPLRMGDTLRFELRVLKAGNASVQLSYSGTKDGVEHLRIAQTIVFMNLDTATAVAIPDNLRPGIEAYLAP